MDNPLRYLDITPRFMARMHMLATIIFLLLIYPSMVFWKDSVPYLVGLSVWANFAGHLSAWQAARAEIKLEQQREEFEEQKENG